MSKDQKKKKEQPIILEAEVIEESDSAAASGPKTEKQTDAKTRSATGDNTGDKTGNNKWDNRAKGSPSINRWLVRLVIGLLIFIGGLFSAPSFERGLVWMGLMQETSLQSNYYSKADAVTYQAFLQDQIKVIANQIADLQSQLDSVTTGQTSPDPSKLDPNKLTQNETINTIQTQMDSLSKRLDSLAGKLIRDSQQGSEPGSEAPSMGTATAQDIAALQDLTRTQQVELSRLAQLIETITRQKAQETSIVDDKLVTLEGALALTRSESRSENQTLANRITALEATVKAMAASLGDASSTGPATANHRARLVVQLSKIRDIMIKGEDATFHLSALRPDLELLQAPEQLAAFSLVQSITDIGSHIKPLSVLQSSFSPMATAVKKAEGEQEPGFFSSLFTVRKKGEKAEGTDKSLYQAEVALNSGDIARAVTLLKAGLSDAPLKAAEEWIKQAENHLVVLATLDKLLALVAAEPKKPTSPDNATGNAPENIPDNAPETAANPETGTPS